EDALRPNQNDPKPDVVEAALRLELEAERGPAGPPIVAPRAASTRPGERSVGIWSGRADGVVQVRIRPAGQELAVPVSTPLERVPMHIVDAPGVRRIAADRDGMAERRALLRGVVRAPGKIRLETRQRVSEGGGGRGPGSRRIFPLCLGG